MKNILLIVFIGLIQHLSYAQTNNISNFLVTDVTPSADSTGIVDSLSTLSLSFDMLTANNILSLNVKAGSSLSSNDGLEKIYQIVLVKGIYLFKDGENEYVGQINGSRVMIFYGLPSLDLAKYSFWELSENLSDGSLGPIYRYTF